MGFPDDVEEVLRFGTLPAVRAQTDRGSRVALLEAYVENYVAQEVRIEAAVRHLDAFGRFLEVAALANAQVTNVSGIARDAAVARPTVQGYFETLVDTLLGVWLPAWRARAKIKESAHPKFYFFDVGIARALGGRLREPLERVERGPLLETYLLHELRAWINLSDCGGDLSYWRTPSGSEVDFVWRRAGRAVGMEVKATDRWGSEAGRPLRELVEARFVERGFGVYLGARELKDGPVRVLPLGTFLRSLCAGRILP
jgi:predicted AAA+ superfamily ATPase